MPVLDVIKPLLVREDDSFSIDYSSDVPRPHMLDNMTAASLLHGENSDYNGQPSVPPGVITGLAAGLLSLFCLCFILAMIRCWYTGSFVADPVHAEIRRQLEVGDRLRRQRRCHVDHSNNLELVKREALDGEVAREHADQLERIQIWLGLIPPPGGLSHCDRHRDSLFPPPPVWDNDSPPKYEEIVAEAPAPAHVANHTQATSHHGAYHGDVSNVSHISFDDEVTSDDNNPRPVSPRQIVGVNDPGVAPQA